LMVVSVWLASGLEVRSSFEELLPSDVPSAAHAKELARRVGGVGSVLVNIEAQDGPSGLPQAEKLAVELADDFMAMGPDSIRTVESTAKPTKQYFADHWPLFAPAADLQKALDALERRVEDEGPFNLHLDDEPQKQAAPAANGGGAQPLEKEAPFLDPK